MSDSSVGIQPPESLRGQFEKLRYVLASRFLPRGILSVVDQGLVSAAGFATSVAIGRTCGREELGVYYLVLSVLLVCRGIQEQLISAPYMIYCNQRSGEALATYSGSSLVHQLSALPPALKFRVSRVPA